MEWRDIYNFLSWSYSIAYYCDGVLHLVWELGFSIWTITNYSYGNGFIGCVTGWAIGFTKGEETMTLPLIILAFSLSWYLVGYITILKEYGTPDTKTLVLRNIRDGAGVALLLGLMIVPLIFLEIANYISERINKER